MFPLDELFAKSRSPVGRLILVSAFTLACRQAAFRVFGMPGRSVLCNRSKWTWHIERCGSSRVLPIPSPQPAGRCCPFLPPRILPCPQSCMTSATKVVLLEWHQPAAHLQFFRGVTTSSRMMSVRSVSSATAATSLLDELPTRSGTGGTSRVRPAGGFGQVLKHVLAFASVSNVGTLNVAPFWIFSVSTNICRRSRFAERSFIGFPLIRRRFRPADRLGPTPSSSSRRQVHRTDGLDRYFHLGLPLPLHHPRPTFREGVFDRFHAVTASPMSSASCQPVKHASLRKPGDRGVKPRGSVPRSQTGHP